MMQYIYIWGVRERIYTAGNLDGVRYRARAISIAAVNNWCTCNCHHPPVLVAIAISSRRPAVVAVDVMIIYLIMCTAGAGSKALNSKSSLDLSRRHMCNEMWMRFHVVLFLQYTCIQPNKQSVVTRWKFYHHLMS